ncbi:RNA-directed DNA polymerase [Hibiscus syriacus]|uniref:RNA-directed DNA polymerase n=1 Tax=Hibiscus syriacus TaxID=106335 RepID=A0A6A2ZLK8_HIBSY|nr:RNA-directed DNA polymerase [Hibiscus syriacus]
MIFDSGSTQSNLECFLHCTTPTFKSQFLPKSEIRNLNRLWHPWEREKIEYFTLGYLWNCYNEWSAYGAGVPIGLNNIETLVQYDVPYISAIQIFTGDSSVGGLRLQEQDGETLIELDVIADEFKKQASDSFYRWRASMVLSLGTSAIESQSRRCSPSILFGACSSSLAQFSLRSQNDRCQVSWLTTDQCIWGRFTEREDYNIPDFNEEDKVKKMEEKIKMLEDQMKMIKGGHDYYGIDAMKLSLVPNLEILSGSAIRWYNQLSRSNIKTWKNLAKLFLEQYKHVNDIRPYQVMLQSMEKKHNESFRQYAQKWRDLVVQVHPRLDEKETRKLFIKTLKDPYFGHLVAITSSSFSHLVMAGEIIESTIKQGKIKDEEASKKPPMRERDGEVNNIKHFSKGVTISSPKSIAAVPSGTSKQDSREPRREREYFDHILMTYKELYQQLLDTHVMSPYPMEPMKPSYL